MNASAALAADRLRRDGAGRAVAVRKALAMVELLPLPPSLLDNVVGLAAP